MRRGAQSERVVRRFRFRGRWWYADPVRIRPAFTRLLVLLLLLQWGTAFGHCLRLAAPSGGTLLMEICTPDGLRTIPLALKHEEHAPQDHATGMLCPVCSGAGGVALPPPPVALVAPPLLVQAVQPRPSDTPNPAPSPRFQPPPRAPPTS